MKFLFIWLFIIPLLSSCNSKSEIDDNSIPVSIVTLNANITDVDAGKIRESIIFGVINLDIKIPLALVYDDIHSKKYVFLLGTECKQSIIDVDRIFNLAAASNGVKIYIDTLDYKCDPYEGS